MKICRAVGVVEYFLYPGVAHGSGATEDGGDR